MIDGKMHQTTVRFSRDLWQAMEQECARLGVSAAQYLREAALARLAYSAGRRGLPLYEEALAGSVPLEMTAPATDNPRVTLDLLEGGAELAAQDPLARERSREVRRDSEELRGARSGAEG